MLAAIPATAAFAAIPTASARVVDRSQWEAAKAVLDNIAAADAAFTPGWWDTWQKCKAECDAIPHTTVPGADYCGKRSYTTADSMEVRIAQREIADLDAGHMRLDDLPGLREHYEMKRRLVTAAEDREQKVQCIRGRYDIDRLDARAEELGEQVADAREHLMKTPAPDNRALRWKLEQLREEDGDVIPWTADYVEQCFADIARLLGDA
ncbi:hypothetical protein [Croceicoccus bisphenolivorans]|uniref:hypothetical protein n=1 Tax=Croceicoccus bisphenolivorans TaxID=1783232 RepID=UPI00082FF3DB|nr:hypothetical protein [Croceicoccus bisphenolivorans]